MSLGLRFLDAVLNDGKVASLLQHGPIEHLFRANEVEAYEFVREFVKKYQALPTRDTLEKHTGISLVKAVEPDLYYRDLLVLRHTEMSLKSVMKHASDFLLPENKDPDQALATLVEGVMGLVTQKFSRQVVDFRECRDMILAEYSAKFNAADAFGLQCGWPTLDKASGGLRRGDLLSIVGRPASGKTLFLLHAAMHGWRNQAEPQSRLFVSMEMDLSLIQQRMAAMQTHVPAAKIKHADLGTTFLTKLKTGLAEIKGYKAPFWVVDGNLTATVEDISMLCRQLKPDAIFIDGAYLVKHPRERDRFRRVAENADLIKQELASIAPTCTSWQFARTASKKKKGEKADLDDIGYTDAIGQVSSVVLGLMQEESVQTLKQRKIEILKGRSGEVGSFDVHWNWDVMEFGEIVPTAVEDLQFL